MILTFKIQHGRDFGDELRKARQVAEFAVAHRVISSAAVKHFGLKAVISNQLLRKYGRNKTCKAVRSVNLIVPNQGIRLDRQTHAIEIPCLKLRLPYQFRDDFTKVNQIELNAEYAFVSVTIPEATPRHVTQWLGIDRNATGHCAVVANPTTGKVLKLGKSGHHLHWKYRQTRRRFQRKGKLSLAKKTKDRESRIVRDLNHKISRKVVNYALKHKAGIVLEDLKGVRKTKKQCKAFRDFLHSWPFYQLGQFIEYKAKLLGIPVVKIDPRYTSQQCSRCGLLGTRAKKRFVCACGHVEDADVNAAFVIAERYQRILRFPADRDVGKGRIDTPRMATA